MAADRVYHVELRAFPHVARVFNLDRETLDARFVRPWSAGETIEYDDARWTADRTRLTVLAGPQIPPSARGLGRGWGEVTRSSEDVTDEVVAEVRRGADARPELEALKDVLGETASGGGLRLPDVVALAGAAHPGWRVSEQLALAEQAAWEMLHQGRAELLDAQTLQPLGSDRWQEILLAWDAWAGLDDDGPRLRSIVSGLAG